MAFRLVRCTPNVMLMVSVWPESGFGERVIRPRPIG
jgi:hypothetical protein